MDDNALLRLAAAIRDHGYHFVTPTPATHARVNARPANASARNVEDVFGWSRPFGDGVLPDGLVTLMRQAGVLEPNVGGRWRSLVRASSLDGLLFLHSAFPTEAGDAVFFGPDTYRFAAAITAWLQAGRPVTRAIDIGCGAGPGALLVARERRGAEVIAVDVNPAALQLTRVNAALAGLGNVAERHSDLLSAVDGTFDLIVSNPPYLVDRAERAYRHGGGALGESLSLAILRAGLQRLAPGGTLLLYTGSAIVAGADPLHQAVTACLASEDFVWTYHELDPDVFGEELHNPPYDVADRIAVVLLTVTRK